MSQSMFSIYCVPGTVKGSGNSLDNKAKSDWVKRRMRLRVGFRF